VHYRSADWGGIQNWTLKGDKYFGTFIVIDDNDEVILMTREFDEDAEENIDTDIATANNIAELEELFKLAETYK